VKITKVFSKRLNRYVWKVDGRIARERIRESGFETRREAEDFILNLRHRVRSDAYRIPILTRSVTLGELLERRLGDPIAASSRNRQRLTAYFATFVDFAGRRLAVRSISLSHMREFRDQLIAKRLKNSTIEFRMAGVTGALNAARLYFPELETFRAPTLPGLVVESRSTLVPRAELNQLVLILRRVGKYSKTRNRVADLLELLQLTGARVSELTTLEKSQIDFDRHLVTLYGSKTHTRRTIPMSDRVEMILRSATLPSYASARQTLEVITEQEGIRFNRGGWVIHDIRHTAASVLAEAGISHSIIAALLGHRLGGMTAIYTHATLPALKQAVSVLETYWLGEQKPLRIVSTF
jgi:integrase